MSQRNSPASRASEPLGIKQLNQEQGWVWSSGLSRSRDLGVRTS